MKITIEYDKEAYYPGDFVTTTIIIHVVHSPVSINSIRIAINGFASIRFLDTDESSCSSYHSYISRVGEVWKPPSDEKSREFVVGKHPFTYRFRLPLDCDSSFSDPNKSTFRAKIRYDCTVKVERKFCMFSVVKKKFKVVRKSLDVSRISNRIPSVSGSVDSRFFPYQKGTITAKATLPKLCYSPGETIYLDASVSNQSPRTIISVHVILMETNVYRAYKWKEPEYKRMKKCEEMIQRSSSNRLLILKQKLHVISGDEYAYAREIIIPRFVPRHFKCTFFEVKYCLQVRFTCSLFGTSLTLNIPLVIGIDPSRIPMPSIPAKFEIREEEVSNGSTDDFDDYTLDDTIPLLR